MPHFSIKMTSNGDDGYFNRARPSITKINLVFVFAVFPYFRYTILCIYFIHLIFNILFIFVFVFSSFKHVRETAFGGIRKFIEVLEDISGDPDKAAQYNPEGAPKQASNNSSRDVSIKKIFNENKF